MGDHEHRVVFRGNIAVFELPAALNTALLEALLFFFLSATLMFSIARQIQPMTTRARLKILLISIGMLFVLSSAAQTVTATGSVSIDWVGTYSITNLDTGATTWFQVSVALAGRPADPTILSGSGTVAVCLRPPNPSIAFICDVDQSTPQSFAATGTLTTDLTSGQSTLTWVVQGPSSPRLPQGSTVRVDFLKLEHEGWQRDAGPFALALPDGTQVTGNSILLCRGC